MKTHKERVEELNKYLSNLSEHHDMYVWLPPCLMDSMLTMNQGHVLDLASELFLVLSSVSWVSLEKAWNALLGRAFYGLSCGPHQGSYQSKNR